jgi:hypothetical protein
LFQLNINYSLGDWGLGLGIGDWGLGIGPNPQSPIPNPQSPIPNPHWIFFQLKLYNQYLIHKKKKNKFNNLIYFT